MKRREFIKVSSLLGASTLSANRLDGVTKTIFDNKKSLSANRFGMFYANLNSEQMVSTTPFEGDKFPTTMLNAIPDAIQNETRVLYPMVRKSYLQKKGPSNSQARGQEEFVRVSWDTALDLAAKALKENFDKYGPESIYGECYWWGGSGKISWGRTVAHRMLKVLGGYVEESGDYSTGAGLVIMPHVLGSSSVYDTPTKWKAVMKGAKNIVFWGTDPIVTNQIAASIPTHDNFDGIKEVKKLVDAKKITAYSVDVRKNDTQRYFNSNLVSIVPNTDTALLIGMCHYLYSSDLYDKEFIKKYTVGFNKFKNYFLGKDDGIVKDSKWASKICGLPQKEIEEFATKLVKEPTLILIGRAVQRQDHGEQTFWALVTLSSMLGHVGKTGCGFEFSLGYNSQGADDKIAPILKGLGTNIDPKYNDVDGAPWLKHKNVTIPSSRSIQALEQAGQMLDHDGHKIKLPKMRVAYLASGSIFTRHQNVNNAIKQWAKFDTVITAEPYWTSTAKMSDIVFPVALEPERVDINQSSSAEYIIALKPAITPMGESKSDFWICNEICKRWGRGEVFSEGKDELGFAKQFYEDALNQAKALGVEAPNFEEFWEQGYARFDKPNKNTEFYTRLEKYREDPYKHKLGTPSGKIEIFSPVIAGFNYDDCLGHPAWFEPIEWLGKKEVVKKYPIHIVSPHSRYRLHSQLNNSIIRNYAEVSAREPMLIHPENAKKRGIQSGDIVRIFNDRGEILAGALVTDLVRKDVCVVCEGAWYDPDEYGKKGLCQHGCVNVLTIDKGTSKLAQSNIAHTSLVEIEKYNGVIRPIKAFSKPKIVQSL